VDAFSLFQTSLLEWSAEQFDLVTASLHTFEKLPHLVSAGYLLANRYQIYR
jgi:hypothetical protein